MSRFQCPICGQEQSFGEDKDYGFCQRCGTKLLLRPVNVIQKKEEEALISHLSIGLTETGAILSQTKPLPAEKEKQPSSQDKENENRPKKQKAPEEKISPEGPEIIEEEKTWEEIEAQEELEDVKEEKRSTAKAWIAGILISLLIMTAVGCAYLFWFKPAAAYNLNMTRLNNGQYEEAIEGFASLGDYSDSRHMADVCRLDKALWELQNGKLTESGVSLASIEDKSLDTSTYDSMAGLRIQKYLLGDPDYEKALEELALLPEGRVKDVDNSFLAAFDQSIFVRDYERAAWAFEAFLPYLDDQQQVRERVAGEMEALMDAGRYQDASDLNLHFSSLLADPREDVRKRFQDFLAQEDYFRAAALLEVFDSEGEEREEYVKELKTLLTELLKEEKDGKAIELCFAFKNYQDLDPFLQQETSRLLQTSIEKQDWERMNACLENFAAYNTELLTETENLYAGYLKKKSFDKAEDLLEHLESPFFDTAAWRYDLAQGLLKEEELEKAEAHFRILGIYKDSQKLITEILYKRILKLWDEGKEAEADELIKSLESTDKAEEILREAKLRSVIQLMEKPQMEPAEFTNAYSTLYSIRTHEGVEDTMRELLELWADTIMQNADRRPYLQAMSNMGFVSSKNRAHVCQYVIQNAPPLSGHKKDGTAWTLQNQWLPLNIYRFLELISDDSGPTRAFIQYAMSMDKDNIELDITDIWNLWDLREDVRELSASNEYMLLFLSGVWKSSDGKATLEVVKKNKVLTVNYQVPPVSEEKNIKASIFGLVGAEGRLCDIKLIDYHTIELTNIADGKTYKLTRP